MSDEQVERWIRAWARMMGQLAFMAAGVILWTRDDPWWLAAVLPMIAGWLLLRHGYAGKSK